METDKLICLEMAVHLAKHGASIDKVREYYRKLLALLEQDNIRHEEKYKQIHD